MLSRGFDGTIRLVRPLQCRGKDAAFLLGWSGLFVLMRGYNIPYGLGNLATRLMR